VNEAIKAKYLFQRDEKRTEKAERRKENERNEEEERSNRALTCVVHTHQLSMSAVTYERCHVHLFVMDEWYLHMRQMADATGEIRYIYWLQLP
jgi:hypothetical protein